MAATSLPLSSPASILLHPNSSLPRRPRLLFLNSTANRQGEARLFIMSSSKTNADAFNPHPPDFDHEAPLHSKDGGSFLGDSLSSFPPSSSCSAIDFLTLCHRLKTTKRKGWVNNGIEGPESIADHMYRMALMTLIADDIPNVNRERCIKMAIVHDIAEAIVGDITPSDGVPKEEKSRREQAAIDEMCKVLGGGTRAGEIKELWEEYEGNFSLEANVVKDFDKVEMILQALEYEIEHGKMLDEFFLSTVGKFRTDIGRRWAAEIMSRRNSRLDNLSR